MYYIPICINYQGMQLKGYAYPVKVFEDHLPSSFSIYIQGWCIGVLSYKNGRWVMDKSIDPKFIQALGNFLYDYMHSANKFV